VDDLPDDRDIVLYCACPNEESARRAAQLLMRKGYRRVRPLVGGFNAWSAAGHPVEHGASVNFAKTPRSSSDTARVEAIAGVLEGRAHRG
jgi:3-mercaptopyruvate sulfurtransferase SseA